MLQILAVPLGVAFVKDLKCLLFLNTSQILDKNSKLFGFYVFFALNWNSFMFKSVHVEPSPNIGKGKIPGCASEEVGTAGEGKVKCFN